MTSNLRVSWPRPARRGRARLLAGAAAGWLVLSLGAASPAQATVSIPEAQATAYSKLWSLGNGAFTPALSVGPEVGWNAGLQGMIPPRAAYYRLWDMNVAWKDVNTGPGEFDWTILDQRVQQVESWGGKPIMVLGLTPQWAAGECTAGDPRWGGSTACPPADMEAWRAYVRALVQRYGPRIGAYETWNEANLQTFWAGTADQMAMMVQIAGQEIGGTAAVLAPSVTTRLKSGARFTSSLLAALSPEAVQALDGWSIHSYPKGDAGPTPAAACEQRASDIIDWQRALLAWAASNPALMKPIWDTEVNYGLSGPGATPGADWSDADGAALVTCSYQDSRALGIAVTAWYEYTAVDFDLLGVQMNPATSMVTFAYAALPSTVGLTNPWIPTLPGRSVPTTSGDGRNETKTIRISGQRGTVKGKPGVIIDGVTTGFDQGEAMVPYIKFPGQTSYSKATARPLVDADGDFSFQRKSRQKIYIYFTNEDGTVRSERIIIRAR